MAHGRARARGCSLYGDSIPGRVLADRLASYVHLFNLYWYSRCAAPARPCRGWRAALGCACASCPASRCLCCSEPGPVALQGGAPSAGSGAHALAKPK